MIKKKILLLMINRNRFHVSMGLYSYRSRTKKLLIPERSAAISDTLHWALSVTFLFLRHYEATCDLLLNRCMTTRILFVRYSLSENRLNIVSSSQSKKLNLSVMSYTFSWVNLELESSSTHKSRSSQLLFSSLCKVTS